MFRGLRWRLTLISLLGALALLALIGVGTTWLQREYFASTTDLALRYRMAGEFRALGLEPPAELQQAEQSWQARRGAGAAPAAHPTPARRSDGDDEGEERGHRQRERRGDDELDSELAPILAVRLSGGGWAALPQQGGLPFAPDRDAAAAALAGGSDLRTVRQADGTRLRLLTYRLPEQSGAAIQLGRALADQDRVLGQITAALAGLGGLSALLMALGIWWVAGRALLPAQQSWERQQTFVANASHELRTPLTLIRASAEMALRGTPRGQTDQRALLGDLLQECDYMARLIDDLLLLSRIDAGRLALERGRVALAPLLEDARRQVERVAGERGVRVELGPAAGEALGDATRLRQVLLILLDNALRHTPGGGAVRLSAGPAEPPHGAGRRGQAPWAQISVADSGAGIAPRHLPHIFERFYQADSARGSANGSTGLGLAIAAGLIEAQGGRISVESQPGQGTRVTLLLPAG